MSYLYIDADRFKNKPKFSLHLPYPRRTKMRNLTEIYNVNLKLVMGKVHELSFDIPAKVERNHELVPNELIELFEGYYLVKMEWNGLVEYFVYVKGNKELSDNGKSLKYQLYSTPYLIGKKAIPVYEEESKNLPYHANFFLEDTNWTIGEVDSVFKNKYRALEASQSNALQCLYEMCEKFEAVMVFDSVTQTVHFREPKNVGINKGMQFKEGIFLESLGQEIKFDELITRLYVYGSDGLEFRNLSLTGVNYLQDLSWFIYPYEEDSQGNVIKHSKHLTDGFCKSYIKYNKLLAEKQPIFSQLSAELTQGIDDGWQLQAEIASLAAERNQINNELFVINATYGQEAPMRDDWNDAMEAKQIKNRQIKNKRIELVNLDTYLQDIQRQIEDIRLELVLENNFTDSQIEELNNFTHASYYTNDSITDEKDLLEEAERRFKELNTPPITLSLGIVNFLNDIKFEKIHNRIALGDTVTAKSEDLNVDMALKIIEINYDIDNENISLTISNEKDLRDDMRELLESIYSSSHTSNVVSVKKSNWDKGGQAKEELDELKNNPWDASLNIIKSGYGGLTTMDEYGLRSVDREEEDSFLFINAGILSITRDNGDSIDVAIDKDGIHARNLVGSAILGENLRLTSDDGIIEMDGETITIKDGNGDTKVELGSYLSPTTDDYTYGLNITGGAFDLRTSTNSNEGLVLNSQGMKVFDSNGNIIFDTTNGNTIDFSGNVMGSALIDVTTNIRTTQSIDVGNSLYINDSASGYSGNARVYCNQGNLYFNTNGRFDFNGDIYINGKKVLTES